MTNMILDKNFKEISIEDLDLDIISYNYCINNRINTLNDVLNISISTLRTHNLINLFNKVHSLNLKFYYEDQLLKFLKIRYNSGENIRLDELRFIFDIFTNQYSYQYLGLKFYNITQLKNRIKLLISANFFTNHDLILIQQLFNVDVKKIINELEKDKLDPNLNLNLRNLALSSRAVNPLIRSNIETLGMLILIPSYELMNFRNLGSNSTKEIIECVHSMGYKFIDETNTSYDFGTSYRSSNNQDINSIINVQTEKNNEIKTRIEKKKELLKIYKNLILEKEALLNREKELDLEIENAFDCLNKLYGEKPEKVKKYLIK